MEITSLPVGVVDKIVLSETLKVYDGYEGENEVVGEIHKGEYFVYKIVGEWYLIDSHQWIKIDFEHETPTEEVIDLEIIEDIEESIEEEVEVLEIKAHEESNNETTNNLFKVMKRFFGKK